MILKPKPPLLMQTQIWNSYIAPFILYKINYKLTWVESNNWLLVQSEVCYLYTTGQFYGVDNQTWTGIFCATDRCNNLYTISITSWLDSIWTSVTEFKALYPDHWMTSQLSPDQELNPAIKFTKLAHRHQCFQGGISYAKNIEAIEATIIKAATHNI